MKIFQTKLRQIGISIDNEFIIFTYPEEENRDFYHIPIKQWKDDLTERQGRGDNWHYHMMEKEWFSSEMKDYIDSKI